ncbi:hypothetical protein WA158_007376 [Blastocystis sp. Blastoise]
MESAILNIRSFIFKNKIGTIGITLELLNSLTLKESDQNGFLNGLKKSGFHPFILAKRCLNLPNRICPIVEYDDFDLNKVLAPQPFMRHTYGCFVLSHQRCLSSQYPYVYVNKTMELINQGETTTIDYLPSLADYLQIITGRKDIDKEEIYSFGGKPVLGSNIFYENEYIYGITNLKPTTNGHVLLIPKRPVPFFTDLHSEELQSLSEAMQTVSIMMKTLYKTQSITLCVQDGPLAGQTVQHIHVHVIPRVYNDFVPNDKIYQALNTYDLTPEYNVEFITPDDQRHCRTNQEMKEEAEQYKSFLKHM